MVKTIKELGDIANDILKYMETKHPLPIQQYSIIISMMRDSILVTLISQIASEASEEEWRKWSEKIMEQKRKKKEEKKEEKE